MSFRAPANLLDQEPPNMAEFVLNLSWHCHFRWYFLVWLVYCLPHRSEIYWLLMKMWFVSPVHLLPFECPSSKAIFPPKTYRYLFRNACVPLPLKNHVWFSLSLVCLLNVMKLRSRMENKSIRIIILNKKKKILVKSMDVIEFVGNMCVWNRFLYFQ